MPFSGSGALEGAAAGGSAGAIFGPYGAVIGAGAGGLLGGFTGGGEDENARRQREAMEAFYAEVQGRAAPQLGPAGQAGVSDFRADQRDLVGRLQALASGQGPSLAQEQMRQGVDRATNQQYAMAAGARGNAGLAQRNAMNNAGMLQSQAAGQGAMARAAEQLGALGQLGGATSAGRSMDDQMSQFNTGQGNAFQLAQLDASLRAEAQRDQARLAAMGRSGDWAQTAAQQPNLMDKLTAAAVGYGQMRANQRNSQPAPAQRPYGDNTINPFQAY